MVATKYRQVSFIMEATYSTIWDLLDHTAQKYPKKGLMFLENGLNKLAVNITYSQLRHEALVCASTCL